MQTYTFSRGTVGRGLFLSSDEKLGQVLLLGEAGRGRTLFKVGLDRRNPAEVRDGCVYKAIPTKITIPPKEGKAEFTFFVLSKPKEEEKAILVRINTVGTYTKDTYGGFSAVEGKPETIVAGHGAYGDAGRIGGWNDSLVIMHPGDIVRVVLSGGHKFRPYVLVCNADSSLAAHDFDEWQKGQAQAKAVTGQAPVEILFGMMPAFSFGGGQITAGIKTSPGLAGPAVSLGDNGRGRKFTLVPLVNLPDNPTLAGVGKSGGNIVLTTTERTEINKALVRIDTRGFYKRGHPGKVEVLRGNPERIAYGYYAQGDAGGIYSMDDDVWVVGVGDVLKVEIEGYDASHDRALYLKEGILVEEKLRAWKLQDALRDPSPFIAKNWCPVARLPEEWIGSVVAVYDSNFENHYGHGGYGLASVKPLALDMGWNDITPSPYNTHIQIRSDMVWVERLPDLKWNAPVIRKETREEVKVGEPPFPAGTRVKGNITTQTNHLGGKYCWVTLENVPAVKHTIGVFEKSGIKQEIVEASEEIVITHKHYTPRYKGELSAPDFPEMLEGEFTLEFHKGKGSAWWMTVHNDESLDEERLKVQKYVEADQTLRKWGVPIDVKPEYRYSLQLDEGVNPWGMPVDENGRPCPPSKAVKWVLYSTAHLWPAYPKEWILGPHKGFRSLSEGSTFMELLRTYLRKL